MKIVKKKFRIERIKDKNTELVVIYRNISHSKKNFFSINKNDNLQIGYQALNSNQIIKNHFHLNRATLIKKTTEVLYILSGKMKVYIFDKNNNKFCHKVLKGDNLIYFKNGGHGFKILDDKTKFFEIKQGPYLGLLDKKII